MAEKKTTVPVTKATATAKPAENLYQVLAEIERTIQQLSSVYATTESSQHIGAGGQLKLTPQQETIKQQLADAQARYDRILKILENQ